MTACVGSIEKVTLNNPFFREKEEHVVGNGDAVVVPAGTRHNIINTSSTKALRLYTIYSPPNHPDGTVHKTKADAIAAEGAG